MSNFAYTVFAVILFGVSILISNYVKRRRFYRRNVAGIEEFSSYSTMLLNNTFEKILFIIRVACILLAVGFIGLIIASK